MERSVHVRNGKVGMTDRKLQTGNCFEKRHGLVQYIWTSENLFKDLTHCESFGNWSNDSFFFKRVLLTLYFFFRTDCSFLRFPFLQQITYFLIVENEHGFWKAQLLFPQMLENFKASMNMWWKFLSFKKKVKRNNKKTTLSSVFKNSSMYRFIKQCKNYLLSDEQPVDTVSI